MPYGDDQSLEEFQALMLAAQTRMNTNFDIDLREKLRAVFDVPESFMDLAIKIWWDGKED